MPITKIGTWFWFPIPEPGFGDTLPQAQESWSNSVRVGRDCLATLTKSVPNHETLQPDFSSGTVQVRVAHQHAYLLWYTTSNRQASLANLKTSVTCVTEQYSVLPSETVNGFEIAVNGSSLKKEKQQQTYIINNKINKVRQKFIFFFGQCIARYFCFYED